MRQQCRVARPPVKLHFPAGPPINKKGGGRALRPPGSAAGTGPHTSPFVPHFCYQTLKIVFAAGSFDNKNLQPFLPISLYWSPVTRPHHSVCDDDPGRMLLKQRLQTTLHLKQRQSHLISSTWCSMFSLYTICWCGCLTSLCSSSTREQSPVSFSCSSRGFSLLAPPRPSRS